MVPPKRKRAKPFLLFLFDLYNPQVQKKAVLSHISILQLGVICEIAYNIHSNKNLVLQAKCGIRKKNRLISALAKKKMNSSEKVILVQKKWLTVLRMAYIMKDLIELL